MKLSVLGSGSEGNSFLFTDTTSAILVDAGFSAKRIVERLAAQDVRPEDLAGICLTHEHTDHIRGAGVLARRYDIPLYATAETFKRSQGIIGNIPHIHIIENSQEFTIEAFEIRAFTISHDAVDPVGYVIQSQGIRAGICTDIGHATHLVRERLASCHSLILEMNHDVNMLLAGPYPWSLKQRIRSRLGHLSNDDGGQLLSELWHENLQHVYLAHLSRENNMPDLAHLVARQTLDRFPEAASTELHIAKQHEPSPLITIREPSNILGTKS